MSVRISLSCDGSGDLFASSTAFSTSARASLSIFFKSASGITLHSRRWFLRPSRRSPQQDDASQNALGRKRDQKRQGGLHPPPHPSQVSRHCGSRSGLFWCSSASPHFCPTALSAQERHETIGKRRSDLLKNCPNQSCSACHSLALLVLHSPVPCCSAHYRVGNS